MPDKRRLLCAPEESGNTLVLLFDEHISSDDAQRRLEDPELPPLQWVSVTLRFLPGYVELQPRPVEADGLADGFYVRLLESEDDAKPAEGNFVAEVRAHHGDFAFG